MPHTQYESWCQSPICCMQAYMTDETVYAWQFLYEEHKGTHHWAAAQQRKPSGQSSTRVIFFNKNQRLCYQLSQIKCLTDELSYVLILVKTEANVDFKFLQVICCIHLHWITKTHMLWIFMEKYSHNIHSFEILSMFLNTWLPKINATKHL
jgi:hypothetical protein